MSVADKLKLARIEANLSQAEMAKKLGLNTRTYGSYERGERDVSTSLLLTICQTLKISSDDLLGREEWDKEAQAFSDGLERDNKMVDEYLSSRFSKEEERTAAHELIINLPRLELDGLTLLNKNLEVIAEGDTRKFAEEKYRTLDGYGKRMVDSALDIEYERCTVQQGQHKPMISIRYSLLPVSAGAGEYLADENIEMRLFPDTPEARQADIVIPVDGRSMEPMFYNGDELYVHLQNEVKIGDIGIFKKGNEGYVKKVGEDRLKSLNPEYKDIYPDDEPIECIGKVLGKVQNK